MNVEELPSVKEVVATLEEVRQRVSDADIVDASRSAITSAREAVADGWPRRRRASRWPWVAGILVGMTVLGLVLLTPTFRRWTAGRGTSAPAMPAADEPGDPFHPAEPDAMHAEPMLVGATE